MNINENEVIQRSDLFSTLVYRLLESIFAGSSLQQNFLLAVESTLESERNRHITNIYEYPGFVVGNGEVCIITKVPSKDVYPTWCIRTLRRLKTNFDSIPIYYWPSKVIFVVASSVSKASTAEVNRTMAFFKKFNTSFQIWDLAFLSELCKQFLSLEIDFFSVANLDEALSKLPETVESSLYISSPQLHGVHQERVINAQLLRDDLRPKRTMLRKGFPSTGPSIFLAHSSRNKRFARRLADDLKQHGIRVWIDEAGLQIGDSLIKKIENAIDETDYLGVILSPASVKSEWVRREVNMALTREIAGKRLKVLPILWRSCEVPGFLIERVYADLSTPDKYRIDFYRLINRIKMK